MRVPLLTWRLWRGFHRSDSLTGIYHRLAIHRPANAHKKKNRLPRSVRTTRNVVIFFGGILLFFFVCSSNLLLITPLFCLLPFTILLAGTISGGISAVQTATAVTTSREQGRYALVSLTPDGSSRLMHAVGKRLLENNGLIGIFKAIITGIAAISLLSIVTTTFGTLFIQVSVDSTAVVNPTNARSLIQLLLVLGLMYSDLVHSIVIGILIGLLMPIYVQDRLTTVTISLGLYLTLQIGFYVAMILLHIFVLPSIYAAFGTNMGFDLYLSNILLVVLSREAIVAVLWSWLGQHTEIDTVF